MPSICATYFLKLRIAKRTFISILMFQPNFMHPIFTLSCSEDTGIH